MPSLESVQNALDDATVLLIQYIGSLLDRRTAVTTLMITRDEQMCTIGIWQNVSSQAGVNDPGAVDT